MKLINQSVTCLIQEVNSNKKQLLIDMIKDIQINNFRSINKANIKGFRRVNLLFGKNNCGKEST